MAVKPKLALIPSGVKASKVYSVLPSDGVGDFDFSRSGSATRINKDGLIETVDSNVPRLNYPLIDGVVSGCPSLLLEPESRNLITYSEDFNNPSWNKSNTGTGVLPIVNTNQIISPDGTLSADELIFNSGGGTTTSDRSVLDILFTVNTGNDYTGSIWLKGKNNGDQILLGQLSGGYELITLTTEWVRYEFTQAASPSPRPFNIGIRQNIFGIINDTVEVYAWGAQLEQKSYATSYIPTNGGTVTREAETASKSGLSNYINSQEGVLYFEGSTLANDGTERYIYLGDGTTTNRVVIRFSPTINDLRMLVTSGGSTQVSSGTTNYNITNFNKIALKYKQNDFALWVNGVKALVDTNGNTPIGMDELSLSYSGTEFKGNVKQIQYYNTALTDAELEEMTGFKSFVQMANYLNYTVI